MGKRGPKAAPTHLKVLSGVKEYRINRDEPIPSDEALIIPEMSEGARRVWDEKAPDLIDKGCLTSWDTDMFAMYCEAVATYRECRLLLEESADTSEFGKYIDKGAAGGKIKSPYWQIMRDAQEMANKLSARFGFTPGDRANLKIERTDDGPKSGAERILG